MTFALKGDETSMFSQYLKLYLLQKKCPNRGWRCCFFAAAAIEYSNTFVVSLKENVIIISPFNNFFSSPQFLCHAIMRWGDTFLWPKNLWKNIMFSFLSISFNYLSIIIKKTEKETNNISMSGVILGWASQNS